MRGGRRRLCWVVAQVRRVHPSQWHLPDVERTRAHTVIVILNNVSGFLYILRNLEPVGHRHSGPQLWRSFHIVLLRGVRLFDGGLQHCNCASSTFLLLAHLLLAILELVADVFSGLMTSHPGLKRHDIRLQVYGRLKRGRLLYPIGRVQGHGPQRLLYKFDKLDLHGLHRGWLWSEEVLPPHSSLWHSRSISTSAINGLQEVWKHSPKLLEHVGSL